LHFDLQADQEHGTRKIMTFPPNLKRLAQMLGPYRGRIFLALIGMAVTAATEPTLVGMLKVLLDRGIRQTADDCLLECAGICDRSICGARRVDLPDDLHDDLGVDAFAE
jgi:hypothetical protein